MTNDDAYTAGVRFAIMPNPLECRTVPRTFPVDGEIANLLRTCYWETGVMDRGLYRTLYGYATPQLCNSVSLSCWNSDL